VRFLRIFTVIAALVALAWAPARAIADDSMKLFEEGRSALLQGRFDVACDLLTRSLALDPAPGTLLNLADCEEKRGRTKTAFDLFSEVSRSSNELFAQEGKRRASALEPRVATLTLRFGPDLAETDRVSVLIDGAISTALPGEPIRLDPGRHTVTVRAELREDRVETLDLAEAERRELTVALGPVKAPPLEASSGGVPTLAILGLVAGGLGVATLAAATGTGVAMLGFKECFPSSGGASEGCATGPEREDDRAEAKSLEAASTALFIVGGVLGATSIVMLAVAPWGDASVALVVGPARAGVRLDF
jgi:hypothetical protein